MSARFECIACSRAGAPASGAVTLNITAAGDDEIMVRLGDGHAVYAERTGFITKVSAELNVRLVPADAIVIERSELPAVSGLDKHGTYTVTVQGQSHGIYANPSGTGAFARTADPDYYLATARANLALAEHLAALPLLDEAQVKAMEDVVGPLAFDKVGIGGVRELARALIATGRVQVTP
jgi:hypothetical protein